MKPHKRKFKDVTGRCLKSIHGLLDKIDKQHEIKDEDLFDVDYDEPEQKIFIEQRKAKKEKTKSLEINLK